MSAIAPVLDYFKARTWLVIWLAVCAAAVVLLAVTGNVHTQGDGWPTALECSCVVIPLAVWALFKLALKIDLAEELLLGTLFGIQWEFLTEPYWTYLPDKFNVLVWSTKDIPLLALMGWGTNFALALLLSEWLGKRLFGKEPRQLVIDWRVLLTDTVAIQIVGSAAEWLYGVYFHGWDYTMDFGLGLSPLGLPWEVQIGYTLVFYWYGTTMRVWRLKLEGAW
jgi:hypothetical protein